MNRHRRVPFLTLVISLLLSAVAMGCAMDTSVIAEDPDGRSSDPDYPGVTKAALRGQLPLWRGDPIVISGDVLINDPLDVDAFCGTNVIEGSLTIENISSLRPPCLYSLYSVSGTLTIRQTGLTDLTGLNGLDGVLRSLTIEGNSALTSLSGLDNVDKVANLSIRDNDSLTSLDGLGDGELVVSRIYIQNNDSLTSLNGFDPSFWGEYRSIEISDNDSLSGLGGLESIEALGNLVIRQNASLTSLDGLNNLVQVGFKPFDWYPMGNLIIRSNPALSSLDGLEHLQVVGGSLEIESNPALATISGLNSLTTVNDDLYMQYNDNLFQCLVYNWISGVIVGGTSDIKPNGPTDPALCD